MHNFILSLARDKIDFFQLIPVFFYYIFCEDNYLECVTYRQLWRAFHSHERDYYVKGRAMDGAGFYRAVIESTLIPDTRVSSARTRRSCIAFESTNASFTFEGNHIQL